MGGHKLLALKCAFLYSDHDSTSIVGCTTTVNVYFVDGGHIVRNMNCGIDLVKFCRPQRLANKWVLVADCCRTITGSRSCSPSPKRVPQIINVVVPVVTFIPQAPVVVAKVIYYSRPMSNVESHLLICWPFNLLISCMKRFKLCKVEDGRGRVYFFFWLWYECLVAYRVSGLCL